MLLPSVREVETAIRASEWRDPGPDAMRRILGRGDLSDLVLFETIDQMWHVARLLNSRDYVDGRHFCMVRSLADLRGPDDPRLVLDCALIVAGSKWPGDDEFVVVDLRAGVTNLDVKVLDWSKPIPDRWISVTSISALIQEIARTAVNGPVQSHPSTKGI